MMIHQPRFLLGECVQVGLGCDETRAIVHDMFAIGELGHVTGNQLFAVILTDRFGRHFSRWEEEFCVLPSVQESSYLFLRMAMCDYIILDLYKPRRVKGKADHENLWVGPLGASMRPTSIDPQQ